MSFGQAPSSLRTLGAHARKLNIMTAQTVAVLASEATLANAGSRVEYVLPWAAVLMPAGVSIILARRRRKHRGVGEGAAQKGSQLRVIAGRESGCS